MPQSLKNRSVIRRIAGATLFAIVLWAIVSLTEEFDTTFDVPLTVESPPEMAPAHPIPQSIRVQTRATGWSLLKMMATGRIESILRPPPSISPGDSQLVIGYGRRDLLASVRTNVLDARQLNVAPDTLALVFGPVDTRRVPLSPEITINTRKGFQVIGRLRLLPDSVTLSGARDVLDDITAWPTEPLILNDVHRAVSQWISVGDTLRNILTISPRRAELYADVQEIAERTFTDVPIVNRGTVRDTSLRLVLQPQRVDVLVRGGARDLSRLDPSSMRAYVEILEGTDTLGVAYPRLLLPAGYDVSVVGIRPDRVKYVFRRMIRE